MRFVTGNVRVQAVHKLIVNIIGGIFQRIGNGVGHADKLPIPSSENDTY